MTELGARADPARSEIALDGRPITLAQHTHVLMLSKPAGFLSTHQDERGRPTVMDFVPPNLRPLLYPVGRLDLNSTGLLLLTNDGLLAFRLTHPSFHVPKRYLVVAQRPPTAAELEALRRGVELEDGPTAPAQVRASAGDPRSLEITLHEGRKRQIRRMLQAVSNEVVGLTRVGVGPLELGDLPPGRIRELTAPELAALRAAVGLQP